MSEAGAKAAGAAVNKLLRRAENAWCAGDSKRLCTLVFSEASFPDYLKLPQRSDQEAVNAMLRNIERDGAIAIDWDPIAGRFKQIARIRLIDANKLAVAAGLTPLWAYHSHAVEALEPWLDRYNVQLVLDRWKIGKTVRGYGAVDVQMFVDGCKVLDQCGALPDGEDVLVRRFSANLFSNSKRIEEITAALDALSIEDFDAPVRSGEEVLDPLGLVKMPQPVLVAGQGTVVLVDGTQLPIVQPYVGIAPHAVAKFLLGSNCSYMLTVENLTTFHELAMGRAGRIAGLLMYTAGMPSPSMLKTYRLALAAAPGIQIWHWGDIDLGGFRIAAALARHAGDALKLWAMHPGGLSNPSVRKRLTDEESDEIVRICGRHGWGEVADSVVSERKAIEQEALPLTLPSGMSA